MRCLSGKIFAVFCFANGISAAADIEGQVVIRRQLTKRKVTPSASSYHRGAAVSLPTDNSGEALDYEREHVVIYLEGQQKAAPVTAVMDQRGRRFAPDMVVIPAGSAVSFPNLDPIFHNVFSLAKAKSFDLGNYPQNQTRTVTFPNPGVIFVHCHLHPNMAATIVVTPNQWHTRASASGRFVLPAVPPGEYTVVAWHKAGGAFRQNIRVSAERNSQVEFVIPLEEKAGSPVAAK